MSQTLEPGYDTRNHQPLPHTPIEKLLVVTIAGASLSLAQNGLTQ